MGDQLDLKHQQHTAAPPNIMNNLLLITIFTILAVVAVSAGPRTRNGSKDVRRKNTDDVSVIKSKFKRKNSVESEITPKKKNKKPRKMDESEGERKSKQKLKGNVDLSNKLRGGNGDKTQKKKPKLKNVNEQKRSGAGKRKGNSDTKRQKMKTNERANIKARATVNDTCLDTSMAMLKIAKDKVTNFLNQYKRMASFNKTAGKRKSKQKLKGSVDLSNKLRGDHGDK